MMIEFLILVVINTIVIMAADLLFNRKEDDEY